jgi:hypothetical protein
MIDLSATISYEKVQRPLGEWHKPPYGEVRLPPNTTSSILYWTPQINSTRAFDLDNVTTDSDIQSEIDKHYSESYFVDSDISELVSKNLHSLL